MLNDPLANALSSLLNAERVGKSTCIIYPSSKLIQKIFDIFKAEGYINSYEQTKTTRGNHLAIKLAGMINKCGAIKPRFPISLDEIEKFEKRFLPGKNFGILIISTPLGMLTNKAAKEKNLGGKLLAYCY